MSRRREARERAIQALYAYEMGGGDGDHIVESIIRTRMKDDAEAQRFATRLFLRTLDQTEAADVLIGEHAQNWEISRIALVDRMLLRLALSEMLAFEDIPPKVSINESIEVAKRYSTERSGQFINGILDSALAALQRDGRLQKSGRGLVGMDSIGKR